MPSGFSIVYDARTALCYFCCGPVIVDYLKLYEFREVYGQDAARWLITTAARVDGGQPQACPPTGSTAASYTLTPAEERDVLNFDPWGERDATYKVLRASFAVVRKPHQCAICFSEIAAGSRVWAQTEVDDGKCATFRFCPECCWCIAHRFDESDDDGNFGFDRMYDRWEIGRTRAEAMRG